MFNIAEPTIPVCPAMDILSVFCIINKPAAFNKREVNWILVIIQKQYKSNKETVLN